MQEISSNSWKTGLCQWTVKWKRRFKMDAKDYFMNDGMLWHRQESMGKRQTFQDQIDQVVVPTSERYDIMHGFHTKALAHCGFDKMYLAVSRV